MNGIGFVPRLADAGRCLVTMRVVRSLLVVELPPALDEYLRFGAAAEPFAVEQLVAQFAVEAFDETVLPWGLPGAMKAGPIAASRSQRITLAEANSAPLSERASAGFP